MPNYNVLVMYKYDVQLALASTTGALGASAGASRRGGFCRAATGVVVNQRSLELGRLGGSQNISGAERNREVEHCSSWWGVSETVSVCE